MRELEFDYVESNTGDFIVKRREWSGRNSEEKGALWSERKTTTMIKSCRRSVPLVINSTGIY